MGYLLPLCWCTAVRVQQIAKEDKTIAIFAPYFHDLVDKNLNGKLHTPFTPPQPPTLCKLSERLPAAAFCFILVFPNKLNPAGVCVDCGTSAKATTCNGTRQSPRGKVAGTRRPPTYAQRIRRRLPSPCSTRSCPICGATSHC